MQKNLGQILTTTKVNIAIVIVAFLIRLFFLIFCAVTFLFDTITIVDIAVVLVATVVTLLPLRHLKDEVCFYQNGLSYNKREWTYEEITNLQFVRSRDTYQIITRTKMQTNIKVFDVTYLKDVQAAYQKAYQKTI